MRAQGHKGNNSIIACNQRRQLSDKAHGRQAAGPQLERECKRHEKEGASRGEGRNLRMLSSWAALGTGASEGLTGRSTSGWPGWAYTGLGSEDSRTDRPVTCGPHVLTCSLLHVCYNTLIWILIPIQRPAALPFPPFHFFSPPPHARWLKQQGHDM